MSASTTTSGVYFIEDVCKRLQLSRRTLDRRRRHGCFPIPELPAIDNRPRWAIEAVEAFRLSHATTVTSARAKRTRTSGARTKGEGR